VRNTIKKVTIRDRIDYLKAAELIQSDLAIRNSQKQLKTAKEIQFQQYPISINNWTSNNTHESNINQITEKFKKNCDDFINLLATHELRPVPRRQIYSQSPADLEKFIYKSKSQKEQNELPKMQTIDIPQRIYKESEGKILKISEPPLKEAQYFYTPIKREKSVEHIKITPEKLQMPEKTTCDPLKIARKHKSVIRSTLKQNEYDNSDKNLQEINEKPIIVPILKNYYKNTPYLEKQNVNNEYKPPQIQTIPETPIKLTRQKSQQNYTEESTSDLTENSSKNIVNNLRLSGDRRNYDFKTLDRNSISWISRTPPKIIMPTLNHKLIRQYTLENN